MFKNRREFKLQFLNWLALNNETKSSKYTFLKVEKNVAYFEVGLEVGDRRQPANWLIFFPSQNVRENEL